jgi:O-succinylbenzoic acid--CoA ligase
MEELMFDVDFENPPPQLICHPDYRIHEKTILEKLNPFFLRDHLILFSSGTTGGDLKGYALSKKSLFANAEAVNTFFGLTSNDVWALSLPIYHVGGLSVLARAHLLKNKIIDARSWDPEIWVEKIKEATITTIVPTQLYDLVKKGLKPSPNLRYLIVGGDFLSSELKNKAIALGWPVIRTFGMSEVSSQLASAKTPESDELEILPIHEVKIQDERLLVKSKALFTLEFQMGEKFKVNTAKELSSEGFYLTKDRALVQDNVITPLGRMGDEIKIAGHLINLTQLKDILSTWLLQNGLYNKVELAIEDDERKGKKLILIALKEADSDTLLAEVSKLVRPAKIDELRIVEAFNRTHLGKLKKS